MNSDLPYKATTVDVAPDQTALVVGPVTCTGEQLDDAIASTGFRRGHDILVLIGPIVGRSVESPDLLSLSRCPGVLIVRSPWELELDASLSAGTGAIEEPPKTVLDSDVVARIRQGLSHMFDAVQLRAGSRRVATAHAGAFAGAPFPGARPPRPVGDGAASTCPDDCDLLIAAGRPSRDLALQSQVLYLSGGGLAGHITAVQPFTGRAWHFTPATITSEVRDWLPDRPPASHGDRHE